MSASSDVRSNQFIRTPKVRLIDADGENRGIVTNEVAQQAARDAGLDLVEIAANADPPVVKVIDMGKYLFELTKKERQARKAQTKIEVKEIRLRPKTNVHHRGFKVEDARRWLEHGMKVRVTIKFRGREITYPEIALEDLKEIAEALKDVSKIEASPSMEGKSMTLVLAPDKSGTKKTETGSPEKPSVQAEKVEAPAKVEKAAVKAKIAEVPAKPEMMAVKTEKAEVPAKPEKMAVKTEKAEVHAKPEKTAVKTAKAQGPAKTEKSAVKTAKAEGPAKTEKTAKTEKVV